MDWANCIKRVNKSKKRFSFTAKINVRNQSYIGPILNTMNKNFTSDISHSQNVFSKHNPIKKLRESCLRKHGGVKMLSFHPTALGFA